ncbi:MAG: hypothetical protein J6Q38_00955 [Clostridia bacterium]|nr:hypothetical protein [Clostridia bacterium]
MDINRSVALLEKALEKFSPVVIDYGGDKVVGFPNDINNNDLVIYVKKTELVMTFGYQNAHFAVEDIESCVEHSRKYLESEYTSVEFFQKAKDLFGGSRPTETVKFDTVENIVNCYSMGNESAKEGLYKFLKANKNVTFRAVNFNNSINNVVEIVYENDVFSVKVIR